MPDSYLAIDGEAEQPCPVPEPHNIFHSACVPLQLEHHNPQRHINDVYEFVLAAACEEAAAR